MRIRDVRWDLFRIPLRDSFGTAQGATTTRDGLIVRLITDEGIVGIGEISPMPAFSGATLDATLRELKGLAPRLVGVSVEDVWNEGIGLAAAGPAVQAVKCGLEVAAGDALARQLRLPLACLLSNNPAAEVPANATIALANRSAAIDAARDAVADGFRCVKVKVGMCKTLGEELDRIEGIRDAIGKSCTLRIDANGAWTVDQAIETIRSLESFHLDLVEQPVAAGDIEGMAAVRESVSSRIGADEAVYSVAAAKAILVARAADVLVIKPMVIGGLQIGREVARLAREAGCSAIVTTTIDSGIGIAAALHLAAALPGPVEPCGIATGRLLTHDLLIHSPSIRNGNMVLPLGNGLGVDLDDEKLSFFKVGPSISTSGREAISCS